MKKNRLKSIFVLVILCLMVMFLPGKNLYATSLGVSSSSVSMYVGETRTVTISGENITGRVDISTNNSRVASISASNAWIENNSITLTITGNAVGSATITVTPSDISDSTTGEAYNPGNRTVTVTVSEKPAPTPTPTPTPTPEPTPTPPANNQNTNNTTNTSTTTKSSNNYLKVLQVNEEGLTPNFSRTRQSYAITVGADVTSLRVTATPEDSSASVAISGNTNLQNGDNTIYITVTAQNGAKRYYSIIVTKTSNPENSNSYLENLIVENAKLNQTFSKEVFEYTCEDVGADVETLKILAFPEIESAKVEITGNDKLVVGENNIVVKVTSVDGTTTKEYKIKVVKTEESVVNTDNLNNPTEEENAYTNVEDKTTGEKVKDFFSNLIESVKANALLVIMYFIVVAEFIEVVILYNRLNKYEGKKVIRKKDKSKKEFKDLGKELENDIDKSKDNVIKANINNVRLQGSDTKNASHELKRTRNGNLQDNLSKDKNQRNDKDDKNKK